MNPGTHMFKLTAVLTGVVLATTGCSVLHSHRSAGPLPPDWDIASESKPLIQDPLPVPPPQAVDPQPLDPGIPVNPHVLTFQDSWISFSNWAQVQGYGPLKRVSLPAQPLSNSTTNGYHWNNLDLQGTVAITPFPAFSLRTGQGELVIQQGTRQAYWNGVSFYLAFEPRLVQGELLIRDVDVENTIHPLLEPPDPAEAGKARTIVIDPGHGGRDAGSTNVANHYLEKTLTLDWATRLASKLEQNGWHVILTRTNDVDLSPAQRIRVAEDSHADLFLGLRFNNSNDHEEVGGVEANYLVLMEEPANRMRHHAGNPWATVPPKGLDAESLRCALRCEQALIETVGATDHGVSPINAAEDLGMQKRPAVFIAGGYLSNPREAAMIANPEYRERLANAVARALE